MSAQNGKPVELVRISLEIDNVYDGHEIQTRVETRVPLPPSYEDGALQDWADEWLFPHTGTGNATGDAGYFVTIKQCDEARLVNRKFEFV